MSELRERLRTSVIAVIIGLLIICLVILNRNAAGQPKRTAIEAQFIGSWMLARMRNEKNADVTGPNPMGMLVFDAAGNYSSMVMRSDLPEVCSVRSDESDSGRNPDSNSWIYGTIWHLHRRDSSTIKLHVVGSLLPNWDGGDQTRSFVLKGDELELTNLTNSSGDATVHAFWKRVTAAR